MKKSLIALAILAASGAALAQSSVTVYGRVDASVGTIDELGKGSTSKLFSGGTAGLTTPRLGFMGKEDLGGGLSATFKLEQRIDIDTGALQDPSFKGESSVGLAGGLGGFVLPIMFGYLLDLTGIRSSAFMLLYGIVWVSLIWMYMTEVRSRDVVGGEPQHAAVGKRA